MCTNIHTHTTHVFPHTHSHGHMNTQHAYILKEKKSFEGLNVQLRQDYLDEPEFSPQQRRFEDVNSLAHWLVRRMPLYQQEQSILSECRHRTIFLTGLPLAGSYAVLHPLSTVTKYRTLTTAVSCLTQDLGFRNLEEVWLEILVLELLGPGSQDSRRAHSHQKMDLESWQIQTYPKMACSHSR